MSPPVKPQKTETYYDRVEGSHIQTLFGPPEEGYGSPPEPEPGDSAWRKLTWVLYPLMSVAVFYHGQFSRVLDKAFWTLFLAGLLITSEWAQLKRTKVRLGIAIAMLSHLCVMTISYDSLPEHRRLMVILFIVALESIVFGVPIKLLNNTDDAHKPSNQDNQ